MGLLALMSLLDADGRAEEPAAAFVNPLAAKPPHFKATAKSVIWCFIDGGPSHIDLFDPKPALTKLAGKPLPPSFKRPVTAMGRTSGTPLLASQRKFKQHGQAGHWVSDWYPEIASCADDLAILKGCYADGLNHVGSICQMNTGDVLGGRPCLGSWSLYGLGSVSQELPGYVVLLDNAERPARRQPQLGHRLYARRLSGRPLPRRQNAYFVSRTAGQARPAPGASQVGFPPSN